LLFKKAFTLIELIFVIIVLGLLAAIAIPKFAEISKQSYISKAKSTYTAIQAGIQNYKTKHVLLGQNPYPTKLNDNNSAMLFTEILTNPIKNGTGPGEWEYLGNNNYRYHVTNTDYIDFIYNSNTGTFTCIQYSSTIPNVCKNFKNF